MIDHRKRKPPVVLTSARLLQNRPEEGPIATAAAELGSEYQVNQEKGEPKQAELLAKPEAAKKPAAVQNGRMLATYVGLGLERDKDNEKLLHLDFSFPLEAEHDGHIPKRVREAWAWLKHSGNKGVQIIKVPAVVLDVYVDPTEKKPLLHVADAEFTKAIISLVEETGKGQSKLVTRFAFRLRMDREKKTLEWAAWADGDSVWLKIESAQKELDL